MTRIPWYYIWSDKYEIFHTIFQDITSRIYPFLREEFAIRPIFIEQSEFDQKLNKTYQTHSFTGCNIKIDALIKCIESNMGSNFIFSDIDIVIHKSSIKEMIIPKLQDDMTFMTEDTGSTQANIGFCLIKATQQTLEFWKQIQKLVVEESGHDQTLVNRLLKTTNLKTSLFSEKDIISQKTCTPDRSFKIIQILSSGNNSTHWQYIEKIHALPIFINLEPYTYLISPEIREDIQIFNRTLNSK